MLNCPYCEQDLTPHEIGVLFAAVGRTQNRKSHRLCGAKLISQDANHIRKSKEPIRKSAERYNVSFTTIWRIKKYVTHKIPIELKCPRCGHELTPKEIGRLFATLGGSKSTPRKTEAAIARGLKMSKL